MHELVFPPPPCPTNARIAFAPRMQTNLENNSTETLTCIGVSELFETSHGFQLWSGDPKVPMGI